MITGINKSEILTKHVSCEYKCKLIAEDLTRIKSGITINVSVSAKIKKNIMCAEKIIFGILLHKVLKMVNMQEVLLAIQ